MKKPSKQMAQSKAMKTMKKSSAMKTMKKSRSPSPLKHPGLDRLIADYFDLKADVQPTFYEFAKERLGFPSPDFDQFVMEMCERMVDF